MKQETLEEAAEYYAHNYFDMHETNNYKALKEGFVKGAKWQQERMYSEEDRLKRSDKLWKKLVKELSVLQDDNFTARQLFDFVERHYR